MKLGSSVTQDSAPAELLLNGLPKRFDHMQKYADGADCSESHPVRSPSAHSYPGMLQQGQHRDLPVRTE